MAIWRFLIWKVRALPAMSGKGYILPDMEVTSDVSYASGSC